MTIEKEVKRKRRRRPMRLLVQNLIDECLDMVDKGIAHDGLESVAAIALLKRIEELESDERKRAELMERLCT